MSVPPMSKTRWRFLTLGAIGLAMLGCRNHLDDVYGRRAGVLGGESVNGTAVLGELFQQAGHRVFTWRRLSPRAATADVIFWCPDRFELPGQQAEQWLEDWLAQGNRTLIYVGRDFDAAPDYWNKILPAAPQSQRAEVTSRRNRAQAKFTRDRNSLPGAAACRWFSVKKQPQARKVRSLAGPWSQGVDAQKVEIQLASRLELPQQAQVLLSSADDPIVGRLVYDRSSQVLVIANGSFLLNLPLVNHEHRILASRLLQAVGSSKKIVFLESGPGVIEVLDKDPQPQVPTGTEMFAQWPLNWILFHLSLFGILLIAARWPILGLAKAVRQSSLSDFGKHITALGSLLQQTQDRTDAIEQIEHYQQVVLGEEPAVVSSSRWPSD